MSTITETVAETEITVTKHTLENGDQLTVFQCDGAVVRVLPERVAGTDRLVAYIGNGYVDAAGIDTLIQVLQAVRVKMS